MIWCVCVCKEDENGIMEEVEQRKGVRERERWEEMPYNEKKDRE